MPPLTDTSLEAEEVLRQVYREMPFERKWRQMGVIYHTAKVLHAAGVRLQNPAATDEEIHEAWMAATLGEPRSKRSRRQLVEGNDDNLRVVQEVIQALTDLEIPYALGGSWASSLLGKMRFTHDADLTVEPFPGKETTFCGCFADDYYLSLPAVEQAVRQRSSFNIIHTPSAFKVDVFIRKERPFEESLMQRRQARFLPTAPDRPIQVVSPEDLILLKLEWYRLGGEISETQWKDVLGVLQVQAGRLDQSYLDHWARELRVEDLLIRARQESQT